MKSGKIIGWFKNVTRKLDEITNQNNELLWSDIWHDTIRNIEWLKNPPSLSPGRWAIGYNYIYVMTRVLEEKHPHNILDLGLGISSSLISQYCDHMENTNHTIIEQDKEWVDFYSLNHKLSSKTSILHKPLKVISKYGYDIRAYDDFGSSLKGKYDFISIDGPHGSEHHSRRDIVDHIPEVLDKSFVIMMDDTNRGGEKETIDEIKSKLKENGIEYSVGDYKGNTDCTIIVSKDNTFLCSL